MRPGPAAGACSMAGVACWGDRYKLCTIAAVAPPRRSSAKVAAILFMERRGSALEESVKVLVEFVDRHILPMLLPTGVGSRIAAHKVGLFPTRDFGLGRRLQQRGPVERCVEAQPRPAAGRPHHRSEDRAGF